MIERGSPTGPAAERTQVLVLLQGKLADVSVNFKEVLEVRTKNIQASRSRTENFVSSVSSHSHVNDLPTSDSPLYQTPTKSRSPAPGSRPGRNPDLLDLDPSSSSSFSSSALARSGPVSDQQMLMMEEAQTSNGYINARGEAIEAIERTIGELGSIFGQLASMVSEQSEMIERIDANTEDVVDNVQGAQRQVHSIQADATRPVVATISNLASQGTHEVLASRQFEPMAGRQDDGCSLRLLSALGSCKLERTASLWMGVGGSVCSSRTPFFFISCS